MDEKFEGSSVEDVGFAAGGEGDGGALNAVEVADLRCFFEKTGSSLRPGNLAFCRVLDLLYLASSWAPALNVYLGSVVHDIKYATAEEETKNEDVGRYKRLRR